MAWELRKLTTFDKRLIDVPLANRLANNCRRGEVFFLTHLGKNLDPYVFSELCKKLDKLLTSRNQQISDNNVPSRTPPSDSIYPNLMSATAAEKQAEAEASAAAAVEAAYESAAERIELQDMSAGKNNEYQKHCMENADS